MLYVKGKICEGRMWRKAQLTEGCCGVAKYYSIYLGLKSLNNVRNAFPATPLKGISLPRHVHLPKCSVVSANRVFPFCLQVDLTLSAREQKLSVWHIFCVGLRPSSLIPCSTQVQARNGKFFLFSSVVSNGDHLMIFLCLDWAVCYRFKNNRHWGVGGMYSLE